MHQYCPITCMSETKRKDIVAVVLMTLFVLRASRHTGHRMQWRVVCTLLLSFCTSLSLAFLVNTRAKSRIVTMSSGASRPRVEFYIIRHGESTGNRQGILQGQMDYPLTDIGERRRLREGYGVNDEEVSCGVGYAAVLLRLLEMVLLRMGTEGLWWGRVGGLAGRQQAVAAGKRLAGISFDVAFSSDLSR